MSQVTSPLYSMDEAILRFSSESLHSFSYAIVSQNSISTRIAVLKRSLEYLRDNPLKLRDLRLSLSLVSPLGQYSRNLSSASSATLSMLSSLNTTNNSTTTSALDNLSAVLNILQNASSTIGSKGHNMTSDNATTSLLLTGNNPTKTTTNPVATGSPQSPSSSTPTSPRKRTLTNVNAAGAETQVIEALATPYIDVAWTSIMQRTGSVSSLSAVIHSMSSLNLGQIPSSPIIEHAPGTAGSASSTSQITPLSSIASKFVAKHSVFTTKSYAPFHILSSNDIACLVFGISQSEMKSRPMWDVIPQHLHAKLEEKFNFETHSNTAAATGDADCSVVMCGALYPILKSNDQQSLASFWVKHNASKGFLVWVVEEILNDSANLNYSAKDGVITKISGPDADEIFPNLDRLTTQLHLEDVFPSMSKNREQFSQENSYEYHTLKSADNTFDPCYTRQLDTNSLQISSLPNIAGVIILNKQDYSIADYNLCFLHALLGYGTEMKDQSINCIIPHFTDYLTAIRHNVFHSDDECFSNVGLVIPEHMFRKAAAMSANSDDKANVVYTIPTSSSAPEVVESYSRFLQSSGISAINVEGRPITVDIQLRVVSPKYIALWVSYSRSDISGESQEKRAQAQVPSQLKLLHSLKRSKTSSHNLGRSSRSSTVSSGTASDDTSTPTTGTNSSHTTATSVHTASSSVDSTSTELTTSTEYKFDIGAQRRTKKFSDFEVLQEMGEGAYGKVLLARYKKEPQYTVVVKCVIKERILVDTWTRDRKLGTIPNEIKVMAALNSETIHPHPNIIKLLDFFEDDNFYHIEMERHGNPGTDLFDLIEIRPNMEEPECRQIFRQVTDAVAHLHQHGIVHRDIKDENIVVDEQTGVTKLIDFGSSAFLNQGPFDVFVGTIDYAAPEVLGGNPYTGKPQDIWALGILLYTIMYKENPFYNVDEIMDGELRIPFIPSDSFLDLVKCILCRDVNKRPTIEDIRNHKWFHM